jgi:L-histidine N-alpha-methyltransferase
MDTETFTSDGVVEDTKRGLTDSPKWLSSLYFYDETGSELFERITETEEYYPTRTEGKLLDIHGTAMLEMAGKELLLAELGSGSSSKTRTVIRELLDLQGPCTYMPVDVSSDFLKAVAHDLERDFPGLDVKPVAAEYVAGLGRIGEAPANRRLVLFLGSSIGNFEPDEQVGLLQSAYDAMQPGDAFLLGTDLVKDAATLNAAYNDAAGYTAAFNENILSHLDGRLDGDNAIDAFKHVAFWHPELSRIEMHLEATRDVTLTYPRAEFSAKISKGERIHTENSYKFTMDGVREMAQASGWTLEQSWIDDNKWFGLHLLRR